MGSKPINPMESRLDDATSRRLAKLRTMPIDVSSLEKAIALQIPQADLQNRFRRLIWMRPARTVAASLLVVGLIIAFAIATASGPVLASAQELAELHRGLRETGNALIAVQSIPAAQAAIKEKWPGCPQLCSVGDHPVHGCCVRRLGHKSIACISLQIDQTPVTVAVADSADVRCPDGKQVELAGNQYSLFSSGATNVIMTQRAGRWVALMSSLPSERLLAIAEKLEF